MARDKAVGASLPADLVRKLEKPRAESVLLPEVTARIAVEQASTFGWERCVDRRSGRIIGMNTFGASSPLKEFVAQIAILTRARDS